jgi:hypothetical protein
MKFLNLKKLAIMLVMFVLITNCKDEEQKGISVFAGNYAITNAELAEALIVPTNEAGNVTLPVGTEITELIKVALLSAVSCSDPDTSWVELREDYSLYLSCEGANQLNAGTWDEVSVTSIKLNLNNTAIPSSPTGVALTVTNLVVDGNTLTGATNVPLPKTMIQEMLTPMQYTLSSSALPIYNVKFSIEFIEIL